MDKELLGNLRTYSEVYEYVSKGTRTKEEFFHYLQEIGKARSTADEQVKKVFTNQVQLLAIDGEHVSIDKDKAYSFVSDICECFGLSVVCSPHAPKPEDEIQTLKEENARYTVQMLEEAEWNTRRFISFLKSGMSQSEIRMKREVAREFIAEEWNVVAEYNGQRCRFQMVPMEELQLFLELLKGEYYDKATRVLEKVINTKRKAFFVENDSANEIIAKDVEKED